MKLHCNQYTFIVLEFSNSQYMTKNVDVSLRESNKIAFKRNKQIKIKLPKQQNILCFDQSKIISLTLAYLNPFGFTVASYRFRQRARVT